MMVASPGKTPLYLLSPQGNDRRPEVLPTLLASVRANPSNADLASSVFGLLSNVALHVGGATLLRDLRTGALVTNVIRDHRENPELHSVAFSLLQSVGSTADDSRPKHLHELADLTLQSI